MTSIAPDALSRRAVLALLPGAALVAATAPAFASTPVGTAVDVSGTVQVQRVDGLSDLLRDADVLLDDTIITQKNSFAGLILDGNTTIRLGSDAQILIDAFVAEQGGVLELGTGAMVFDRPDDLPKTDITLKTTFGMIGVRGTKFFAGPSKDVFGVFVERGSVSVANAGVEVIVEAGFGTDIPTPDSPPSPPKAWGAPRIEAAYASVGL